MRNSLIFLLSISIKSIHSTKDLFKGKNKGILPTKCDQYLKFLDCFIAHRNIQLECVKPIERRTGITEIEVRTDRIFHFKDTSL